MVVVLSLLVAMTMVVAVGLVARAVLYAGRSRSGSTLDAINVERALLEQEKERALRSIRELELDLRSRKVSQEDYDELRAQQEEAAVRAIRALRQLDVRAQSEQISGVLVVLILPIVLWIAPTSQAIAQSDLPAGHPPIESPDSDLTKKMVGTVPESNTVNVSVWRADRAGALLRYGGVEVLLEARRREPGPGEVFHLMAAYRVTTDPLGTAVFSDVKQPEGTELRVTVIHDGYAFFERVGSLGGETTTLIVYDSTADPSSLSYRIQVQFSIDERMVRVTTEYVVLNDAPYAVRLGDGGEPFYLPLVSPVVAGQVVRRGWLPSQAPGNSSSMAEPRGRVHFGGGGVAFSGLVLPGETTRIRLVYPIDIVSDFVYLGVKSENIPIRELYVAMIWGTYVEPSMDIVPPSRGVRMDRSGERIVLARVLEPIGVDDAAIVRLGRLPDPGGVRHDIALWGGAVFVFLFVAAVLRARANMTGTLLAHGDAP